MKLSAVAIERATNEVIAFTPIEKETIDQIQSDVLDWYERGLDVMILPSETAMYRFRGERWHKKTNSK